MGELSASPEKTAKVTRDEHGTTVEFSVGVWTGEEVAAVLKQIKDDDDAPLWRQRSTLFLRGEHA